MNNEHRDTSIWKLHRDGYTFKEIAEEHSLSVERVRQIIAKRRRLSEKRQRWDGISPTASDPVERFEITVRTYNNLRNLGIETVGDYLRMNRVAIVKSRNFGLKSFNEAETLLAGRDKVSHKEYMRLLCGSPSSCRHEEESE